MKTKKKLGGRKLLSYIGERKLHFVEKAKMFQKNKLLAILKVMCLFIPVIYGLYVIQRYGVNVAFWDEWEYFINKDTVSFWDFLWNQHNEHRMLFPNIVTYFVGTLFSWNSKIFMFVSQLFLLGLYVIVIKTLLNGKQLRNLTWLHSIECLVLGFCIYNPSQYENMLWGFQIAWYMIVSLGTISFYLYERYIKTNKTKFMVLSMLLAVIVSFSSLHGLAIWGGYILLFIAMAISKEKVKLKCIITVLTLGVLSGFLYFWGWKPVDAHSALVGKSALSVACYFISQIGCPLLPQVFIPRFILGFGLLFIAAMLLFMLLLKSKIIDSIKIIGPMIFSLGAMMAVAFGRGGSSYYSWVPSRYSTNSMLFLLFLLLLCIDFLNNHQSYSFCISSCEHCIATRLDGINRRLLRLFCIIISFLLLFSYVYQIKNITSTYEKNSWCRIVLANYRIMSDEDFECLYSWTKQNVDPYTRNGIFRSMEENKENVFSDDLSDITFEKTNLPEVSETSALDHSVFNSDNISVDDKNIRININSSSFPVGLQPSKLNYYLIINGIAYRALWNDNTVKFVQHISILNSKHNEVQVMFVGADKAYLSEIVSVY